MILCEWCGDDEITRLTPLFAEIKDGKAVVYRWYECRACGLEFKLEDEDATREYEVKTGR